MKRLFPAAALMALCISCSPTPYDSALSDAAKTVVKLTKDTGSNVTLDYNQGTVPADLTFYPRVTTTGFDYTLGFAIASTGSDIFVRAVANDTSTRMLENFGYGSVTIPNLDSRYSPWSAWPTKDAVVTDAYLFLLTFDALYPLTNNSFGLFRGLATTPHVMWSVDSDNMHNRVTTNLAQDVTVLGGAVEASTSTSADTAYWLVRDVPTSNYAEVTSSVTWTAITLSLLRTSGYPYALSFLDMNEAADAARNPNASFASWYDTTAGKWVCYRWAEYPVSSGIYPYVQLPIDHRIDALLSTGQLLSTEGGMGRLYDRDGNLLATFPMGTLRFLSEEYVGGVARTYFTQCLTYNNGVHFTTYWIATAELATLGI